PGLAPVPAPEDPTAQRARENGPVRRDHDHVDIGVRHPLIDGHPRLAPIFTLEDALAETSRVDRLPLAQRQRLDADKALRAELVHHAAWAELSKRVPTGQSCHEDD